MTDFDTLRVKLGRRPITVVELDLDFCGNEYGVPPCMAVLGETGTEKCFNTFKTCQDPEHYAKTTKTYRFCSAQAFLPIGTDLIPCIADVDIAPTQLDPSGFSVSASVTVNLRDFPHHDRGIDPYAGERTYEPRGTFFGKLRARNPYIINRVMRVNTGYVSDDRAVYTSTRTYFIDRMEGPDAAGNVKFIGKDLLRFAEAEKAEAPTTSRGTLSSAVDTVATSLPLKPSGIGSSYPISGTVRLGDELITYTGRAGDTLTGCMRGSDGTTAASHDVDDTAQLCIRYTASTVPDILYDLLVNYAGVNPAYVPLTDWQAEAALWIGSFLPSRVLSDPKGVKDLVEEILDSTGCAMWWDEHAAQLRFKVIVPVVPEGVVPLFNERDHILQGSLSVRDLEKERISRVLVYLNPISETGSVKRENFRTVAVTIDAEGEGVNAYGNVSSREILSRWVPSVPLARELSNRLLSRYKETPRQATFRIDAKDHTRRTGDLVDLETRLIQRADGLPGAVRFIVTEVREVSPGTHYEYVCLQVSTTAGGPATLIAPDATPDWTAASETERKKYMFISGDSGAMSDLQPGPKIT